MRLLIAAMALALPFAALQAVPAKPSAPVKRGLAFAEARCAACHGISANSNSPNPESPTFDAIANMPGLTRTTLRTFLRDSHNYPEAMDFRLGRSATRDLADYIITMRRPDYKPEI
jgi:mono/diheme cytochrome c family protein